jgi:tetratricopeptide (TPR) repeat protein
MKWRLHLGRTKAVTLAAGVCLFAVSCVTNRRSTVAPPASSSQIAGAGLTAAELRKAKALAHYATGVSLELREGTAAALPEYLRAYELDSRHSHLGVRLAQIYASRKDYTNAVTILKSCAASDLKSPVPWFWLGVVYRASEQSRQSVNAFQRALQLDASHLDALQNLLDIQIQQPTTTTEVFQCLARAIQQSSTNWQYWDRLGQLCDGVIQQKPSLKDKIGRDSARRCYEKAHQSAPREPELLMRLAVAYEEENDYAKAAKMYASLLALRPDRPQLRERLATAYIRSDQPNEAIAIYTGLLKREPLRHDVYNALAGVYEQLDKDAAAISTYQQSLAINPNQLAPTLRIAWLQMRLKRHDDAIKTLQAAKEKHPAVFQIPYFIALAWHDQKEHSQAIAAFADAQTLAEAAPNAPQLDAAFYFSYGAACERAGNLDKAAPLFRKAIELAPDRPDAYNYLGYMWADNGIHLEESLALIKKAVALDPDNAAYLDSLGWVLFKLNRPAEALLHLQRAVTLMAKEEKKERQEDATLLDHLADVLNALGKRAEALKLWERALKAEPDNKAIATKLHQHRPTQ